MCFQCIYVGISQYTLEKQKQLALSLYILEQKKHAKILISIVVFIFEYSKISVGMVS